MGCRMRPGTRWLLAAGLCLAALGCADGWAIKCSLSKTPPQPETAQPVNCPRTTDNLTPAEPAVARTAAKTAVPVLHLAPMADTSGQSRQLVKAAFEEATSDRT